MPVTPLKTLSQFRPSCGSGSGLRGVLPGAKSWSRGTSSCASAEIIGWAAYPMEFDGLGSPVEFVRPAAEYAGSAPALSVRHVILLSAADAYGVADFYDPTAVDVPVLLEPIMTGQVLADLPATITAVPTTPLYAAVEDAGAAYVTEFGRTCYLHDRYSGPTTSNYGDFAVVPKEVYTRTCPDGYLLLASFGNRSVKSTVTYHVSSVCPLVPDPVSLSPFILFNNMAGIHICYPGTEGPTVRLPLVCPTAEIGAGTHTTMLTGFANCGPNAADIVPPLNDTGVCP